MLAQNSGSGATESPLTFVAHLALHHLQLIKSNTFVGGVADPRALLGVFSGGHNVLLFSSLGTCRALPRRIIINLPI